MISLLMSSLLFNSVLPFIIGALFIAILIWGLRLVNKKLNHEIFHDRIEALHKSGAIIPDQEQVTVPLQTELIRLHSDIDTLSSKIRQLEKTVNYINHNKNIARLKLWDSSINYTTRGLDIFKSIDILPDTPSRRLSGAEILKLSRQQGNAKEMIAQKF